MKANIKWIIKDMLYNYYKWEKDNGTHGWDKLKDINMKDLSKYNTEEEAWNFAGIDCTVIPIRVN